MTQTQSLPLISLAEAQSFDIHADNPTATCGEDGNFVMVQPYDLHRFAHTVRETADLLETAWGIICNAGGGDWTRESAEWQEAAVRYRSQYFAALDGLVRKAPSAIESTEAGR